jgi:dipeptidyl aminopeptidase/acylaminoacyl peptidase
MLSYLDFRPGLRFAELLALSPDDDQVLYADDSSGQFNLVVRSLTGGTARWLTRFTANTVRQAAWNRDGQSVLLLADSDGDESTQLYRVDLKTEEVQRLTDLPGARQLAAVGDPFSPDGRRYAYAGNDRVPTDQDVLVRDLDTGETRRVYQAGGRVYAGHWSPDGSRLSVSDWREGNTDHVVYVLPADGGDVRRLTPDEPVAVYWLGPWLADGSGFLVRTNAGRENVGLAVMDATTGELTWVDTPEWDVEAVTLSGDRRTLMWIVNVDGGAVLRARDLATGSDVTAPVLPWGAVECLSASSDGRRAVMLLSTGTRPWNVVVADFESGALRHVTRAAPRTPALVHLVEPSLVRFESSDGCQVPALLYRPASAPVPGAVLVSIHGGPVYQERPEYAHDGFYQFLVSQGVAVLAPNIRGSSGYGTSYTTRLYRDWGGVDLEDLRAAAGWLRSQPWVDPARIGLYGGSYGGFCVLTCISRLPEVGWAAAVDNFGPSNLVTLARAAPPTLRSLVAAVIGDYEADAEFLMSRSPVTYADDIRTPLLVNQGANDPRVPRHESDQIVERLRARGVEVRYDVYPDEGHGFTKTENQIRARTVAGEFLLRHLGGRT